MRWFRWWGLGLFAVAASSAAFFWFVLADGIVRRAIERTGTSIVGAKVELARADLRLLPLGLTLTGLQVTDPDKPMTNLFEAGRVSFLLDGIELLGGKVIIDEMAVDGVALGTPRKTSGAVKKAAPGDKAAAAAPITFELPDPEEVLRKEELKTVRLAEELQARAEADKERLEKAFSELPDKKRLQEYRARFDALKWGAKGPAAILGRVNEFVALKDELASEMERLKALRTDAEKTAAYYQGAMQGLSRAPAADMARIREKYAITPSGLANMSRLFFEGPLVDKVESALRWRARLEPVVQEYAAGGGVEVKPRGRGADVRFPERRPLPGFLIRKASVSVTVSAGEIKGVVTNITGGQEILGEPLRFRFSGERLKGLDSVYLTGKIDRVRPGRPVDEADLSIKAMAINGLPLASKPFPLTLARGSADLSVKARIEGPELTATVRSALSGLSVMAGKADDDNQFISAIREVLSGVKGFGLQAVVKGTVGAYGVTMSSDLDEKLSASAGRVLASRLAVFEKRLSAGLSERLDAGLSGLRDRTAGFELIEKELGERLRLSGALSAEIGRAATGGKGLGIPGLPF